MDRLYSLLSKAAQDYSHKDPNSCVPDLKPRNLSESLFQELDIRFEQFFSALRDDDEDDASSSPEAVEDPNMNSRLWAICGDLTLILRCCLVGLTLLQSDQKFLLEKCRYVRRVLKLLVSADVSQRNGRTVVRFCKFVSAEAEGGISMELSDRCRPFICAVLEVFADEFLRHQSLSRYLMIVDSASSIPEKLFACQFNHGEIASVLEVISTHFILSVSDEKAFEGFISGLFSRCDKDSRISELSLVPAIVLLLDPVVLSAPKMFQAHVISLVSEAIGNGLSLENLTPDRHMDCHLIAFQKSVFLYSMHMSSLQMDGFYVDLKSASNSSLLGRVQPTFESYIHQVTRDRLNEVLSKSDNSWDSYRCKMPSKSKANLLGEYIGFVKGRQYIFADSCRDTIASIVECIIHRTFSGDAAGDELYTKENTSAPDICLLVSILKLMSVSLIQAIKCLSNSGDSACLKSLGSSSLCEKYEFLISIVNHFQQFKLCLPIQTFLYDMMKSQQTNRKVSMSMLVHFSGLLSLSFSSGLDLLAKGCISIITALLYLFVFEKGDLVALGSLRGLPLQSWSSEIPSDVTGEGGGDKQSIYKVAAEFHRIRKYNLRTDSIASYNLLEDEAEETCNGEIFLDCILEDSKRSSDYAELADFLECKKGKNYSSWLKGRQIYRKWRYEKMIDLRKSKKRTIWKSLKRQKRGKRLKH